MFYFKGLKMPILLRILASKIQKFKAKVPENLKIFRILSHFREKKVGILGCMDTLKPYNSVIFKKISVEIQHNYGHKVCSHYVLKVLGHFLPLDFILGTSDALWEVPTYCF